MPREENLRVVRDQLFRMIVFMGKTPDGQGRHNYWNGGMPAFPDDYIPTEWQEKHEPIWVTWANYLLRLSYDGFHTYRELAGKLHVADLLAASKEESERCSL